MKVESDLPYVSGLSTVTMKATDTAIYYMLNICPPFTGMYSGSITFRDETGNICNYCIKA